MTIETRTTGETTFDVDALIEPHLQAAVSAVDGAAPLLAGMARYHLGWVDQRFASTPIDRAAQGKRMRPAIALLCCAAAGGDPATAAPLAAALELLHNFTLVHDDIQDESETRRHRDTVWHLWGVGQAINAGDALFAAAHIALYRLRGVGVPADRILRLADEFDRMTISIVEGQTLDLGFEGGEGASPDAYLAMIERKTAAIVRYAAWASALLAGAGEETAIRFGLFGLRLGLGFQVHDDLLGIWGAPETTGKSAADDIRRRKQTYPIVILRQRLAPAERTELTALFAQHEVDSVGVERVLALLAANPDVRADVEIRIRALHDEARTALDAAITTSSPARDRLLALVESLATRQA